MFTFPLLIGDIGGTSTRFAILSGPGEPLSRLVTMTTASHQTPTEAIRAALKELGGQQPRSAFLGVAGLVDGPVVSLTNASWVLDAARIGVELGLSRIVIVNDYIPVAAATLILAPEHPGNLVRIGPAIPCGGGPRLALGPGTGLGAAVCVPVQGRYWLQATEAGHVDFGACGRDELAIWPLVDSVGGRITAETILSGPGIVRLYQAMARRHGLRASCRTPAEVIMAQATGEDRAASEAVCLFASLLGRFSGDLVLIFRARGGVFLGSGIPRRTIGILDQGGFRAAFERKMPFEESLRRIPTFVIAHPEPGMLGLASIATTPDRFLFEAHGWAAPDARAALQ